MEATLQVKKVEIRDNGFKDRGKKTRVYFFVESENLLENLVNRRSRPYNEYRKLLPSSLGASQYWSGC